MSRMRSQYFICNAFEQLTLENARKLYLKVIRPDVIDDSDQYEK